MGEKVINFVSFILVLLIVILYKKTAKLQLNSNSFSKNIRLALFWIYIILQSYIGGAYIVQNIFCEPSFGDTSEYIAMSYEGEKNAYRSMLYPLIIKLCRKVIGADHYMLSLYVFQMAVAVISIAYLVVIILKHSNSGYNWADVCAITMGVFFIPQVMGFNMAVLTDSFACSMLIIMTACGTDVFCNRKMNVKNMIVLCVSFSLGILLRYERMVFGIAFFLGLAVGVYWMKREKKIFYQIAVVIFVGIVLSQGFNALTPNSEMDSRHEMSTELILLPRIVPGYGEKYYDKYSEATRKIFNKEMLKGIDDEAVYIPSLLYELEDYYSKEKVSAAIYDMCRTIFANEWMSIFIDTLAKCFLYAFPRLFAIIEFHIAHVGGLDWNYSRFIMHTPTLSDFYYRFGVYIPLIGTICCVFRQIYLFIKCRKQQKKLAVWGIVVLVWVLSIGIWGVVNPSRANDRYVLVFYIFGELWMLLKWTNNENLQVEKC
jgi:hypothetical protein